MEFRVAGNELHLSGRVAGQELAQFKDTVAAHPDIDTVVFRNSPGGDVWSAYRVGEEIRDRGWRTVVVGRCYSACAIMFLGGRTRHYAQASRPEYMVLGFHGPWNTGLLESNTPGFRGRVQLRRWIVERTDGKVDARLLERFIENERRAAFLHAYDPEQFTKGAGASMFFCEGNEKNRSRPYEACERIAGHDAFSMGFVNSAERLRVIPPSKLPAPLY